VSPGFKIFDLARVLTLGFFLIGLDSAYTRSPSSIKVSRFSIMLIVISLGFLGGGEGSGD
jgi:hypothetical protein